MIRLAKAEDMIWVIENGVKEFGMKCPKTTDIWELAKEREANGLCLTALIGDAIVGIGGIDLKWPGVADIWALISYDIDYNKKEGYRLIQEAFNMLIEENDLWRVQAHARTGCPEAHTLLRHLGFKVEGKAEKYFYDKSNAIIYAKVI